MCPNNVGHVLRMIPNWQFQDFGAFSWNWGQLFGQACAPALHMQSLEMHEEGFLQLKWRKYTPIEIKFQWGSVFFKCGVDNSWLYHTSCEREISNINFYFGQ